jgi:DNA-binding transcriptional LysR family regulator
MLSDMKTLATFVEVAKRLSFAEAARVLGVPSSTVTTRINALEAQLGVRLLNRSTRKTALTHEGRDFLQHCRRALDEIAIGAEKLSGVGDAKGLVRISLPSAFPKAQVAGLVSDFRAIHYEISIDVLFEDALTEFIDDGVDLALRGRSPRGDDLFARKLGETPVIYVAPAGSVELDDLPVLTPLDPTGRHDAHWKGVSSNSMEFTLELVLLGQARAYLPLAICEDALAAGRITTGPGPLEPQAALPLFLIYHEKRYQPRRVTLFKDFLIERMAR